MTNLTDNRQRDRETLTFIVKEMAESMTGAQSTKHWAEDALWFDIPPFASRGVQPALKMFDRVFSSFKSCDINIVEEDVRINGDMGIVCTVQNVNIVLKSGDAKQALVRAKPIVLSGEAVSGSSFINMPPSPPAENGTARSSPPEFATRPRSAGPAIVSAAWSADGIILLNVAVAEPAG
jgi:hypothetical protein